MAEQVRRRTRVVGFTMILIVAMTACSDSKPPVSSTSGPVAETSSDSNTEQDQFVSVEVIDAGSEPRRALRYTFQPGGVVRFERSETQQDEPGSNLGNFSVTSKVRTTVKSTGTTAVVEDASSDPVVTVAPSDERFAQGIETQQSAGREITNTIEVSEMGHVVDLKLPTGGPGPVDMVIRFGKRVVAFPTEAVGVGARWVQRATANLGGGGTEATTQTYTVTAIDDRSVTVRVERRVESTGPVTHETADGTMRVWFDSIQQDLDLTVSFRATFSSGHEIAAHGTLKQTRRV